MSYADGLLSTGEVILERRKQHPFVFIRGARWTILAVLLGTALLWLGANMDTDGLVGSVKSTLLWVTAGMYLVGLVVFGWTSLRYVNQEYVLTNRRVLQVEGVLTRSATDSSLEKINDAALSQSIVGRLLDYGDLRILTAAEAGIEDFHMIRGPISFKKAMLDAKHDYELDRERAGIPPGPPIRMPIAGTPTGAGAAPSGYGSSAADDDTTAVQRASNPDEITRTLHNLADLRDRGAITEAEYDAKKVDLLRRL